MKEKQTKYLVCIFTFNERTESDIFSIRFIIIILIHYSLNQLILSNQRGGSNNDLITNQFSHIMQFSKMVRAFRTNQIIHNRKINISIGVTPRSGQTRGSGKDAQLLPHRATVIFSKLAPKHLVK